MGSRRSRGMMPEISLINIEVDPTILMRQLGLAGDDCTSPRLIYTDTLPA
jgi:hypothetical protein